MRLLIFALKRLATSVVSLFVVAVIAFLLIHLSPGDPARMMAGDLASEAEVERIRLTLGLDRPLVVQFASWLAHIVQGDLGKSVVSAGVPVAGLISRSLTPTLWLAFCAMTLSVLMALPLGVAAAVNAGSTTDRSVLVLTTMSFSLPLFLVGYGLVYVLAIRSQILPVQGFVSRADNFGAFARHMVIPTITLSLAYLAILTRITRASMLEILKQDYVRTARAKGMSRRRVVWLHALKNAALPIVATIGNGLAVLIGGVVITETIFAIPGLGRLMVDSLLRRDYPVLQGIILVTAMLYVLLNWLVDVIQGMLDARINR